MALTKVNQGMVSSGGGDIATNTALGTGALNSNTTGSTNTALGQQALQTNTVAARNTAVGYQAGYTNNANDMVAVGSQAAYSNTTGASNTAVGRLALYSNTIATNNTAVGFEAGYTFNRTADSDGYNTFIGNRSGYSLTTGQVNTFVGHGAGNAMTTGSYNAILGSFSGNSGGLDIRTGNYNIILSDGGGTPRYVYNSSYGMSVFGTIGKLPNDSSSANTFVIGLPSGWPGTVETTCGSYTSTYTHYNFRNGNGIVGEIRTSGSGTTFLTTSDYRLKENIAPMTVALEKVAQLKPCTYKWKVDGSDGQGFIAHELQAVVPDCVSGEKDATKVVDIKDEEGNVISQEEVAVYQGIDTSFLVATLTAAIQEQQAIITDLKARIETLEAK